MDIGDWTMFKYVRVFLPLKIKINCLVEVCPPILSTPIMQVTCSYKGKEIENCTRAVEGTTAKFQCGDLYEDVQLKTRSVNICTGGVWSQPNPQCVPG